MDPSLYDMLVSANPETEAAALQNALRRRGALGALLQATGDRALAPTGAGLLRDAQAGEAGMVDVGQGRLRMALDAQQAKANSGRWEREQNERERHNRAVEARPTPSVIVPGAGGAIFAVDPRNPGAPAVPVRDAGGAPVVRPPPAGRGAGGRKMLSDGQVKIIADYDRGISTLENLAASKGAVDTGPGASLRNAIASKVGLDDPNVSAFRAQVGDQLAAYIRSLSGAAASDRERAFLIQNIPKMEDNDQTFNAKLNAVLERLKRLRDIEIGLFDAQGKDISGFEGDEGEAASAPAPAAAPKPAAKDLRSKYGL